jgi:hypothetical protein
MKTFWFKVENGPADEVEVKNAENIKQLKQEIIKQHPRMFGEDQEAGVWNLYKSSEAQEPEDSGDSLDVLGEAGKTSRTALVLRRVSPTLTAPSILRSEQQDQIIEESFKQEFPNVTTEQLQQAWRESGFAHRTGIL